MCVVYWKLDYFSNCFQVSETLISWADIWKIVHFMIKAWNFAHGQISNKQNFDGQCHARNAPCKPPSWISKYGSVFMQNLLGWILFGN